MLPGLAEPLYVRSAAARLDGARLWVDKMIARVGETDLAGDYRAHHRKWICRCRHLGKGGECDGIPYCG